MSTVTLEKVESDVAEGVTPQCVARLVRESRHAPWRDRFGTLPKLGVYGGVTGSVHCLHLYRTGDATVRGVTHVRVAPRSVA
jgi:hypothetical protein